MSRQRPEAPAWIPDWKDPDAYAAFTTRDDLAWQFLRRNPEYQSDWALYESVPTFWPDGGGKTPKLSGRSFADWAEMIYYYATPPGRPGETLEEYKVRMAGASYSVTNLEDGLCRKWGVMSLAPPEQFSVFLNPYDNEYPVVGCDEDVFVMRHHHMPEPYKVVPDGYLFDKYSPPHRAIASVFSADPESIEAPPNVVPIWFSLDHNLKSQLDEALEILKEARRELDNKPGHRKPPSVATLVTALRVYDAWLARTPHIEIQAVLDRLGPHNTAGTTRETARDLRTAQAMIKSGYRKLIGLD